MSSDCGGRGEGRGGEGVVKELGEGVVGGVVWGCG